jgi:hypothetical protein
LSDEDPGEGRTATQLKDRRENVSAQHERRRKRLLKRVEDPERQQPPGFIIIGAQKGGTTSLYRYLGEHPDVGLARLQEVHFFSWWYEKGKPWYLAHFRPRGKYPIVGEVSPSYLLHPKAAERVHQVLPQVKIIALLRNPIDRAYSQHQMNIKRKLESLSFEEAIAQEPERLSGDGDWSDMEWRSSSWVSYLRRGLYADQLEPWLQLFPREQVLVMKSETFFERPDEGYQQALEFLGLPPWQLDQFMVHKAGNYPDMRPETRDRLAEYFAPHNRRLYELLGWDLGWDNV